MLFFVLCRDDFNQSELKPYFAKAQLSLAHFIYIFNYLITHKNCLPYLISTNSYFGTDTTACTRCTSTLYTSFVCPSNYHDSR